MNLACEPEEDNPHQFLTSFPGPFPGQATQASPQEPRKPVPRGAGLALDRTDRGDAPLKAGQVKKG